MKQEGKEEEKCHYSFTALLQASTLINSLLSTSFSVQSFTGKLRAIQKKLEKLSCSLIASNIDSDDTGELDESLKDLMSTLRQAQLIVDQCSTNSYNGGRLRLRSDLDVIISKLDLHIKQFDQIHASGILTLSRAIILSKPGVGASREDMRLYVKDLLSRLRIGRPELRAQSLAALNEILLEDEKYVRFIAAESDDVVSHWVNFLESDDRGFQEEASESILILSGFHSCRGILAMAGAIGPLIRVLETGSELVKERAGRALMRMTRNSENSWSVSAQGGITTLLIICSSSDSSIELIGLACGILKNISGVNEIKRFMVDEGAISIFAKLISSSSTEESIQIQAIELLGCLGFGEGGLESLVHVLAASTFYSSKAREVALQAIESCCFSSDKLINYLMGSGYVDRLLFFIRNGEISVQELALKSVSRLCEVSEEAKRVMGEIGFMNEMVKLLEMRSCEVREMAAAKALCSLLSMQKNRRKFVHEDDDNVNRILRLLDPEEKQSVTIKSLLLSVLLAFTDSNNDRRKILASGYAKNVEKLAENDVMEAKKMMVKKLSAGNRFQTMLNGIWSS